MHWKSDLKGKGPFCGLRINKCSGRKLAFGLFVDQER
jgi:hypothetical protein